MNILKYACIMYTYKIQMYAQKCTQDLLRELPLSANDTIIFHPGKCQRPGVDSA